MDTAFGISALVVYGLFWLVGIAFAIYYAAIPILILGKLKEIVTLLRSIQANTAPPEPLKPIKPLNFGSCRCNHCSADVNFNIGDFQPGQTTTCPKCGLETQLYILHPTPTNL